MNRTLRLVSLAATLLLLLPETSFADETIYTWGYGDIIAQVLNGTKWLIGTGDFIGLFKIVALLSLVYVIVTYSGNLFTRADPFMLPKVYIAQILVWSLFTAVKTDVVIIDRQNAAYDQVITEVPIGVARPIAWFSLLQKVMGERMETVFSLPDNLKYTNSGFFSGIGALLQAGQQRIIDPYLYLSINAYVVDCVVPDVLDGTKNEGALVSSGTLWEDLGNTNPARTTLLYDSANTNGAVDHCLNAYTQLTGRLSTYITDTGLPYAGASLGGYSSLQLSNVIGVASPYFLNYTATGEGFLLQSISMNHLREGYASWAAAHGISATQLGYGSGKAEETVRQNLALTGILGSKYIPVLKGVLTVILVTFIPLLILLLLTPMMGKVALGFLFTLLWLSLWQLGDVILNLIINVKASHFLTVSAGGNYIIRSKEIVDSSLLDYVNMAGSLYWMIPTMAAFVAGGFSFVALSAISGAAAGSIGGQAGGPAGEMAAGSASYGNLHYNSAKANRQDYSSYLGTGSAARFSAGSNTWDSTRAAHSYSQQTGSFSSPIQTSSISAATPVGEGFVRDFQSGFQGRVGVMRGQKTDNGESAVYEKGSTFRSENGGVFSAASDLIVAKDGDGGEQIVSGSIQGYENGRERRMTISGGRIVEASTTDSQGSEEYKGGVLRKTGITDEENIGALKSDAEAAGLTRVAQAIAPGMKYEYQFSPSGALVAASLYRGEQAIQERVSYQEIDPRKGLVVDTQQGSFEFSSGTVSVRGGTVQIEGISNGMRMSLVGSLKDYAILPGPKSNGDGTFVFSADRGAALAEFNLGPDEPASPGAIRTNMLQDSQGDIRRVGLDVAKASMEEGMTLTGTFKPEQLRSLANVLEERGILPNIVEGLRNIADQGRSARVEGHYPSQGTIPGDLAVASGGSIASKDFISSSSGREHLHKDLEQEVIGAGFLLQNALQMALTDNPKLAKKVWEQGQHQSNPERFDRFQYDAAVAGTVSGLVNDWKVLMQHFQTDSMHAGGAVDVRAPGDFAMPIRPKGAAGLDYRTVETVNLVGAAYSRVLKDAVSEAEEKGLSDSRAVELVARRTGEFTRPLYQKVEEAKDLKQSALSVLSTVGSYVDGWTHRQESQEGGSEKQGDRGR
ncbi:MAG: conjugal transfer protein TraG N-terminal domain-containing protein (plasmid) [Candidatus Manganitrophus sp.]|nr:MAG: conjugal transfer protein TraG N-terminal domain-containing protein [Candidatus Manganitrophus sp.]